jgi:hypothetical protein
MPAQKKTKFLLYMEIRNSMIISSHFKKIYGANKYNNLLGTDSVYKKQNFEVNDNWL